LIRQASTGSLQERDQFSFELSERPSARRLMTIRSLLFSHAAREKMQCASKSPSWQHLLRARSCPDPNITHHAIVFLRDPKTTAFVIRHVDAVITAFCKMVVPQKKSRKVSKVSRGVREARAEAREGDQTDEVILVASPKTSTAPPAPCAMRIACSLPPLYTRTSSDFHHLCHAMRACRARRRSVRDHARR
jgi:hypothetical protein